MTDKTKKHKRKLVSKKEASIIQEVFIENFKSIKSLKFETKRVNIFIGRPNTGKSNILEAIGLAGFPYVGLDIGKLCRFKNTKDLFYQHNTKNNVYIFLKPYFDTLLIQGGEGNFKMTVMEVPNRKEGPLYSAYLHYSGISTLSDTDYSRSPIRFYRFEILEKFVTNPEAKNVPFLWPPSGTNMLNIIQYNKEISELILNLLSEFNYKLALRPEADEIEFAQEIEGTLILYPYKLLSATLQRLIFYITAILSNENAVLLFEEPEAHAFPFYTQYLARLIAKDERENQYFITTHNPYFLTKLLEEAPKDDVNVFIAYIEDDQTKLKLLSNNDIKKVFDLDIDIFFNLKMFLNK